MESRKFRFIARESLPKEISIFIWDVDGTITFKDKLHSEVGKMILTTAAQGVQHIFITGRDRGWLTSVFVEDLAEVKSELGMNEAEFAQAFANLRLYPELGLIFLEPPSLTPKIFPGIDNHPLVSSSLRRRIASLFWQEHQLSKWNEGAEIPPRFYVGRDANKQSYLFPFVSHDIDVGIKLWDFIWSEAKEIIGTAEVLREIDGSILPQRRTKIMMAVEIIRDLLTYWGEESISVSPVSTAINFAPVINGLVLDKDWAAGRALADLAKEKNIDVQKLARVTVAIGDGPADFLFSRALLNKRKTLALPFIFVGPENAKPFRLTREQEESLAIVPQGEFFGPEVTAEVLAWLQSQNMVRSFEKSETKEG